MSFPELQQDIVTHRGKVERKAPQHYDNSPNKTLSTTLSNPIPPPDNTQSLIKELGDLFKTIKLTKNQDIISRWESHLPLIQPLLQRLSSNHLPQDIDTLKSFIQQAHDDIEFTKHERSEYIYEKKIKTKLSSFGTINPSEWNVVGFYSIDPERQSIKSCGLCGHAIQNIYIIQKLTEPNKSTKLEIGSECVVNYLDVPINKVDFDLKFNPDKQFVSKINELNSLILELTSKFNPDWGTRTHYEKRKELIDKYTEKFKTDKFLTDSQAKKVLEELEHATEDIKRVRSDIQAKRNAHDSLKTLMESSIPFHDQNSFLKDIYTQWQNNRTLTERQIEAFKNSLTRYIAPPTQDEPEGEHEVKGMITDIRMGSIQTSRGEKSKLIFTIGNVVDISVVEWVKGYKILEDYYFKQRELRNRDTSTERENQLKSEAVPDFHVKYITKGRFRNVIDNGIKMVSAELPSDYPKTDLSVFAPIIPRKWQRECFDKWWNQKIGVVQAGTGSGKSPFAIMGIKKLIYENPNATVIITIPTIELQRQWQTELKKFNVTQPVGLIGGDGGQDTFSQITIGIYNSLRNRDLKADLLIGDESHHLSDDAQQNFTIWAQQHFDRILFISATPGRIGEQVPVICKVSQDELQEEGSIVNYNVTNIPVLLTNADYMQYTEITQEAQRAGMMDTDWGKKLLGDRFRFISNHPLKVQAAVNLIKSIQYVRAIVFFTTTATVDYFYDIVTKEGMLASKIHSKMRKDDRREHLEAFASGKTQILVGAFAISEGLNIPDSDTVILVGGTSKEREFIQRVGRIVRVSPGKDSAHVYQIYAKDTMEAGWVKSRTLNVAKSTIITTREK